MFYFVLRFSLLLGLQNRVQVIGCKKYQYLAELDEKFTYVHFLVHITSGTNFWFVPLASHNRYKIILYRQLFLPVQVHVQTRIVKKFLYCT